MNELGYADADGTMVLATSGARAELYMSKLARFMGCVSIGRKWRLCRSEALLRSLSPGTFVQCK